MSLKPTCSFDPVKKWSTWYCKSRLYKTFKVELIENRNHIFIPLVKIELNRFICHCKILIDTSHFYLYYWSVIKIHIIVFRKVIDHLVKLKNMFQVATTQQSIINTTSFYRILINFSEYLDNIIWKLLRLELFILIHCLLSHENDLRLLSTSKGNFTNWICHSISWC